MAEKLHYYTAEGFEKAKEALQKLKSEDRPRISKEMAEARDKGDLSENAEFDAAKEAQELLEKKIAALEIQLSNARIINPQQTDTSQIAILSKVKLKNIANNTTLDYTLVPATEANIREGKISVTSPIGKGLIGKKLGEKATINVPAGQMTFEILDIQF